MHFNRTMNANDSAKVDPWHHELNYGTCLRKIFAAKKIAFPKGALRRGQTKPLGVVSTSFGNIELSVSKSAEADMNIERIRYTGRLLDCHGLICGRCSFSTYRTVRGRGWLTDSTIANCMDAIDQEAWDWYEILRNEVDANFEESFNADGLLSADEIWIASELRGSSTWKVLYFCTMSAVFVHQKRMYDEFVFKAHPLLKPGELGSMPEEVIQDQKRTLRRLYAIQLDAKLIRHEGQPTDYMRAWVPDALFSAWNDMDQSGKQRP